MIHPDPIRLDSIRTHLKDLWSRIGFKNQIHFFFRIGFGFFEFRPELTHENFWINLNLKIHDPIRFDPDPNIGSEPSQSNSPKPFDFLGAYARPIPLDQNTKFEGLSHLFQMGASEGRHYRQPCQSWVSRLDQFDLKVCCSYLLQSLYFDAIYFDFFFIWF